MALAREFLSSLIDFASIPPVAAQPEGDSLSPQDVVTCPDKRVEDLLNTDDWRQGASGL